MAVSLWIGGSEKSMLDAKEVAKQWPEFQGKEKASIDDNWVQKTVVIYYHVYYDFCKLRCIDSDFDWFIIDHIYKPIKND